MNPNNNNNEFLNDEEEKKTVQDKNPPKVAVSKKLSLAEKCSTDYIFSYETNKELNLLDRRLGYTYIFAFILVFSYIIIYV